MPHLTKEIHFYESFFKRETFLSPRLTPAYSGASYLSGLGLDEPDLYAGRRVLELGAGRGRITSLLDDKGLLATAEQYVVVEPTSAIHRIAELLPPGRATFVQSSLQELHEHVPVESFDTVLCIGVLPHLGSVLADSFRSITRFLRPGGVLMVNSFYNGDRLNLSYAMRRRVAGRPVLPMVPALMQTMLQRLAYGLPVDGLKAFYHRNFPYSFQPSSSGIFNQCREFFAPPNYNIAWSYQTYLAAMAEAGLGLAHLYPTALSLKAVKGSGECTLGVIRPEASVAILGRDWRSRVMAKRLGLSLEHLKSSPDEAIGYDQIVIAYDYVRGLSYADAARPLLDAGYRFGETLFIHQMLED